MNPSQSDLPAGPVEVDLDMPAVTQLWPEFCKIVKTTNAVMLPFLELFGAVNRNGVPPFARNFENPNDLIASINTFLCRQKPILMMVLTSTIRKNHTNQMKRMRKRIRQTVPKEF